MKQPLEPRFRLRVPNGDSIDRLVCDHCEFVQYQNPKLVAGAVVREGDQLLLCRRAIEPRKGFWTFPAGFIENHESPAAGAIREAKEEALCDIRIDNLIGVYSVLQISQVQMFFRAELLHSKFGVGQESLEVQLFKRSKIPWNELAFPTVEAALRLEQKIFEGHQLPVEFKDF